MCRSASSSIGGSTGCLLDGYCSGASAYCPDASKKPEGSACTTGEGAVFSGRCFRGRCMSRDAQCAQTFSRFVGTWIWKPTLVQRSSSSTTITSTASCDSGCGTLACTNTEWNGYCSGELCDCLPPQNGDSDSTSMVSEGTPCGNGATNGLQICLGGRYVCVCVCVCVFAMD